MPESHHRSGSRTPAAVAVVIVIAVALIASAVPAQARAIATARLRYAGAIEPLAAYQPQTVCSPTAKPGVTDLSRRLLRAFPSTRSLGIVRACSAGGRSEHKEGRAFDWAVNAHSAKDRAKVARFVKWLMKKDKYGNSYAMLRRLGIQYLIWNHKIWGSYAASSGWRRYTGADPHTSHVHISFTWAGARKKTSFWTGKVGHVNGAPPRVPLPPHVPGTPTPPPSTTPPPPPGGTIPGTTPPRPQPVPAASLPGGPELLDETLTLAGTSAGVLTTGAMVAGQSYLIEASGTWNYGRNTRQVSDAECSTTANDPTWRRDRSVHPWDPTNDHLDLYVDGTDLLSDPDRDTGGRCDSANHTYRYLYTPWRAGRVSFASWDPTTLADNSGALTIRIIKSAPVEEMAWSVPGTAPVGVTSPGALAAGETYVVTVLGTIDAGGGVTSDAECSVSAADPVWRRDRSVDPRWPTADHLDVLVDRQDLTFDPVDDTGGTGCDTTTHTYRLVLEPTETRPINLRIDDPVRGDDSGALSVRVSHVVAPTGPETVALDTAAAAGASTARSYLAGRTLRITATGTYTSSPGVTADAECSASTGDPVWRGSRSGAGDVTVNGRSPDWRTTSGATCDGVSHSYSLAYTPATTGPLALGVADALPADNSGTISLTVEPVV